MELDYAAAIIQNDPPPTCCGEIRDVFNESNTS
jgi:hypothetical protein